MKTFPTLYKKSSTGKTSSWDIIADGDTAGAYYAVTFGYTDGKKQTTTVRVDEGKNLGKSNETTPYTQACLEAESKWKKQLDKGYTIVNAGVIAYAPRLSPMLAHKYDDHKNKVKWPCHWQPKLDGIRCLAYRMPCGTIIMQSRQGKPFNALPHLVKELDNILPDGIVFDGELYIHGEEFQELVHLIKRDEAHEDSNKIEYHVYDCYDTKNPSLSFAGRIKWLTDICLIYGQTSKIKGVLTGELKTETDMKRAQDYAKRHGYEGIMIRNSAAPYKLGHRSHDLLKVKEFQDAEFEIVGGYENKGKQEGQCTIQCKTADGTVFGVKPEGSDIKRKWYWINLDSLIGKMLTVRFFSWTTSKNPVPRFPIGVGIRDYE
jgi:DNA ligase-1